MLLYVCPDSTATSPPGNCDDLPIQVVGCRGGQILGSWAVGGNVCLHVHNTFVSLSDVRVDHY